MQYFSVKTLAKMASVSSRTLRHYDAIGLLPAKRRENNYRYYNTECVLKLQQILFYKSLGLSLEKIGDMFKDPNHQWKKVLKQHRKELLIQQKQMNERLEAVEHTLNFLEGNIPMNTRKIFKGLTTPQEEENYNQEAQKRWNPELVKSTQKRWKSYSKEKQEEIMAEGEIIYQSLAQHLDKSPEAPEVQNLLKEWHRHLTYFYEPSAEILNGLGNLYVEDPRFRANFDKVDPQLAPFLQIAIPIYCKTLKK